MINIKAAIMAYSSKDGTTFLLIVLLGLQCSMNEAAQASIAKFGYTSLRIPDDFFVEPNSDPKPNLPIIISHLHSAFISLQSLLPLLKRQPRMFVYKDLHSSSHVFVRVRASLEKPYEVPYLVLE